MKKVQEKTEFIGSLNYIFHLHFDFKLQFICFVDVYISSDICIYSSSMIGKDK